MSTTTTLAVDANYLLKKSFLGDKDTYTKEFGHIGGLLNFFLTLRTMCTTYPINKILLFWDGENGGILRHRLYDKYKANRESKSWHNPGYMTEAEIKYQYINKESNLRQRIQIKNYAENLFFRQMEFSGIEADDLMAYYCSQYHTTENIIVYTNDRDICQTVEYDNVNVYLVNKGKQIINKKNYSLIFDHPHYNLKVIKTMCGDDSDNIKGIKGLKFDTLAKYFPQIKTEPLTYQQILTSVEERVELLKKTKKNVPQVLQNILEGIDKDGDVLGRDIYDTYDKIIDLLNPMLDRSHKHELKIMSEEPLLGDRGSTHLIQLMKEDGMNSAFHGNIAQFSKPFFPTILKEKELIKKFNQGV